MGTIHRIRRCGVIEPSVQIRVVVQVTGVDVVQLVALHVGMADIGHSVSVRREQQSVLLLRIGQFVLRGIVQLVGSRKDVVEVAALVIVESEVQERTTRTRRIDEADLVEAHVGLVASREIGSILLRDKSEREPHRRATEETDAGRVGSNGGNIGSQSLHRATHAHVASCSVQVFSCHLGVLVSLLSQHRHCCERHSGHENIFLHHCFYTLYK